MISRNSSYVSFLFFRRSLSSRRYVSASCLRSASSDDALCIAAVDVHYTGLRHNRRSPRVRFCWAAAHRLGRLAGEGCVNALDRTEAQGNDAPEKRATVDRPCASARSVVCARGCARSLPLPNGAAACAEFAPISYGELDWPARPTVFESSSIRAGKQKDRWTDCRRVGQLERGVRSISRARPKIVRPARGRPLRTIKSKTRRDA